MKIDAVLRRLIILGFMVFLGGVLAAEEDNAYRPYGAEEFPRWTRDVYRFEVVAVGSFPFSYILTALTWDLAHYAQSRDASYLPGPFGEGERPEEDFDIIMTKVSIALTVSAVVAVADFVLGLWE